MPFVTCLIHFSDTLFIRIYFVILSMCKKVNSDLHLTNFTAVDMWAVGVIMLSVMSSTYPFFRSPDDITALAELITVFGSEEMKALANKFGKYRIFKWTK